MFSELDRYLFGQGTHYEIYKKLGAHPAEEGPGFHFALWAPHAKSVSVLGDWNGWDPDRDPLVKTRKDGIFEADVPAAKDGDCYKFQIKTKDGRCIQKADPYAFYAEKRPGTASRLYRSTYVFHDADWLEKRAGTDPATMPLAVYEMQPASWMRYWDAPDEGFYSWRDLALRLSEYVRAMGYTHVELIGVAEYPLDQSWGYQVTGYYAPTSRHGSPDDFKYLVDTLHNAGIGVILDWVPAHFPKDSHGLARFDGTPLYEYPDPRKGEQPDWGTKIFNYGSPEVRNFLIGSALYWLKECHVDGLRVDAVASMLYLDYGRKPGEWIPNSHGGAENEEAIEFFRHLNSIVRRDCPGCLMIAEESTAWPHVTGRPEDGALGFHFKWNMGWMHDFLGYVKEDPLFKKYHHHEMTFAMTYASSENFILVLSHDEVVHLKKSMWEKMPGSEDDKYRNLCCAYAFMLGHPGKKLLFMGQDFGQRREWCEGRELDWFLLEDERNRKLQGFVRDLLTLYRKYPALHVCEDFGGFRWINADDCDRSIYSFLRFEADGKHPLVFLVNFTPVDRPDYVCGLPKAGRYKLLLDETNGLYPAAARPVFTAAKTEADGLPASLAYPLKGYGVAVLRKE